MNQFQYTPRKILVTGGCGFIGSNFIRYILRLESAPSIINLDFGPKIYGFKRISEDKKQTIICITNLSSKNQTCS